MWVVMVVTVMLWLPFGRHYSHAARTQGAARKGMAGRMMLHHLRLCFCDCRNRIVPKMQQLVRRTSFVPKGRR
uniref:Putative secreted protein n=1 Tax=Anopheles darlingi TaxID=43151 RepID=A0A2M4DB75_ANODA